MRRKNRRLLEEMAKETAATDKGGTVRFYGGGGGSGYEPPLGIQAVMDFPELTRDDIASGEVWPDDRPEDLIHYVIDLEALVRWCALAYSYEDQEGQWHVNDPTWTAYDQRGNYLAESARLERTWKRVMDSA
jgi:hypothetical protein